MTDIILSTQNGEPVASSLQIAESFGKEHNHVLRDIKVLLEGMPKNGQTPMFYKTGYVHAQNGQTYPMYQMNRDGFSLLVMGFTGKAALEWKLKYIAAFNEMERRIKQPQMTPAALREAILNPDTVIQLCQQIKAEREKNARLTAENAKLTAANEIMQPKADYFDQQVAANQLTGLNETADALRIPRRTFVAWLVERKYLYRNHCNKLVPDPCMNDGLFQPKEYTISGSPLNGTQTMVTPKGRETFRLMLFGAKKD